MFLSSFLACAALLIVAGTASARTELVTWSHVMPCSVDSFQVRYGSIGAPPNRIIDVGRPHQAGGHFSYPLELADDEIVSVCVAAIRGSETSSCSQTMTLDPSSTRNPRSEPAPDEDSRVWCDDFVDGTAQPGWVSTGPGSSLNPVPGLFAVQDLGGANPGLATTSTQLDIHTHFLGRDVDGVASSQWNRYEYSGQMRFSSGTSGVGVTMYSHFAQAALYYRLRRSSDGEFRLDRNQADPNFQCTQAGTGVRPLADVWYAFRVRVADDGVQTRLRAKVWRADQREPEGFSASCTNSGSNRQISGAIGVWSSGDGLKAWDSLSVSVLEVPSGGDPLGIPGKPELSR